MQVPGIQTDRTWAIDAGVDEVWSRVCDTGAYGDWWPWLTEFDHGPGLVAGSTWSCAVAPPLPYVVRFDLHLDRVGPGRHVEARVRGDIQGHARLALHNDGARSCVRLVSDLHPANSLLRAVALVARPMVERGHNWVLDAGFRQFVRAGLGRSR